MGSPWKLQDIFRLFTTDSLSAMECERVKPLETVMPDMNGLVIMSVVTEDLSGKVLHRNFTTFRIGSGTSAWQETSNEGGKKMKVVKFAPDSFKSQAWSVNQWNILDGLKVNGAGSGYFEYEVPVPDEISSDNTEEITIVAELSAKQLFGKDRKDAGIPDGDYMLGKGTNDPGINPNSYPMTDTYKYPSLVRIKVNGEPVGTFFLEDDPADHRGILSWFSQPQNRKLNEAGSYGYLVKASVPKVLLGNGKSKSLNIRFEVDSSLPGGLAIYGEKFGRYPVDPSIIFVMKK